MSARSIIVHKQYKEKGYAMSQSPAQDTESSWKQLLSTISSACNMRETEVTPEIQQKADSTKHLIPPSNSFPLFQIFNFDLVKHTLKDS